ncbi:MAG: hypothetical protein AAF755_01915 [Pseudomonadota bacterium]
MLRWLALISVLASAALADPPVVRDVTMRETGGQWTFDVTLFHVDTGWDDYANAWRIVDDRGNVIGQRNLAHPHVNEQPFTRSLSGVRIASDVKRVGIQARDSVGGWSQKVHMFDLMSGTVVRPTR